MNRTINTCSKIFFLAFVLSYVFTCMYVNKAKAEESPTIYYRHNPGVGKTTPSKPIVVDDDDDGDGGGEDNEIDDDEEKEDEEDKINIKITHTEINVHRSLNGSKKYHSAGIGAVAGIAKVQATVSNEFVQEIMFNMNTCIENFCTDTDVTLECNSGLCSSKDSIFYAYGGGQKKSAADFLNQNFTYSFTAESAYKHSKYYENDEIDLEKNSFQYPIFDEWLYVIGVQNSDISKKIHVFSNALMSQVYIHFDTNNVNKLTDKDDVEIVFENEDDEILHKLAARYFIK